MSFHWLGKDSDRTAEALTLLQEFSKSYFEEKAQESSDLENLSLPPPGS